MQNSNLLNSTIEAIRNLTVAIQDPKMKTLCGNCEQDTDLVLEEVKVGGQKTLLSYYCGNCLNNFYVQEENTIYFKGEKHV